MRFVIINSDDGLNFERRKFAYLLNVDFLSSTTVYIEEEEGKLRFFNIFKDKEYTGGEYDEILHKLLHNAYGAAMGGMDSDFSDVWVYDLDKTPLDNYVDLAGSEWLAQLAFDYFLEANDGVK